MLSARSSKSVCSFLSLSLLVMLALVGCPKEDGPTAQFSGYPTQGAAPLKVSFTDASDGAGAPITNWQWDFGDGATGSGPFPSHTYTAPGSYTVSLTVTTSNGSDTETKDACVTVDPPTPPSANFGASQTSGTAPLFVMFYDDSTSGSAAVTSWEWDFGDGQSSTDRYPAHSYTSVGTYTVSLTVTTSAGSDTETKTDYVTVFPPPTADFSATPTSGLAPLEVAFTDLSTPGADTIIEWEWDFGDGEDSTEPNPVHMYTEEGTYTVSLSIFTPTGWDTETKFDYITVTSETGPPTAQFTATPTLGVAPLEVAFQDLSTPGSAPIQEWEWDFGDEWESGQQNPVHTYASPGTYTVSLRVVTADGDNTEIKSAYITVSDSATPPSADFGASRTHGTAPLEVEFEDASIPGSAPIDEWAWDFGDGSSSTEQHPTHTYTSGGAYTVSLHVVTADGDDTEFKEEYINVESPTPPAAAFGAMPTSGSVPLQVVFIEESDPSSFSIDTWEWDFGDGSTSNEQDPTHTYTNVGTYTVSLTVTTTAGSDTETKTGYITVNKGTPTVTTWPTASPITYGQTLASSTLTGGTASVSGAFAFVNPATVLEPGVKTANVTFTPTSTVNYNSVTGTVNVTVNKATPTVTAWPSASAITYGQMLSSSTLTGGTASVPGLFAFTNPDTAPNAGNYAASVTFTPTDNAHYAAAQNNVNVLVNKATPAVTSWPTASAITYGQTLAASSLSGGSASVTGSFAFSAPNTTPGTGTYTAAVTFTPADSANYNTVTGAASVTVNKATPAVTAWPTASPITYGETLASSILSAGTASTDGVFSFDSPETAPGLGDYAAPVTFTPSDTTNYLPVAGAVNVHVRRGLWYVKAGMSGDGHAWLTAFGSIQQAVDAAFADAGGEIWVAAGTYTADVPANGFVVVMADHVHLYGGFSGTETARETRNWETNYTIIDAESQSRCVRGANDATLDGFTVRNGYQNVGGGGGGVGMYNYASSPTVTNCRFIDNWTGSGPGGGMFNDHYSSPTVSCCTFERNLSGLGGGGGMYNYDHSSPVVTDCSFIDNQAGDSSGGGLRNANYSAPVISRCTFTENTAVDNGGGMDNYYSSPTLDDCAFSSNTAAAGGGISSHYSSLIVSDCTFSSNEAGWGGGAYEYNSTSTFTNCLFIDNSGGGDGGGIRSYTSSSTTVVNCLFTGNTSIRGGGIQVWESAAAIINCTFSGNYAESQGGALENVLTTSTFVSNSIFRGNSASIRGNEIFNEEDSSATVTYSCVAGGYEGAGNISDDPLFNDAANDDYTLQSGSPCIDTGTPEGAPDEDILGVARPQGDGYDMGAYEFPQD